MAQITQDGIVFGNVFDTRDERVTANGIVKRPRSGSVSDFYVGDEYQIVEAPDIKWCGAVLPNSNTTNGTALTINTTGELLNLINQMQDEIYVLTAAVIALSQS